MRADAQQWCELSDAQRRVAMHGLATFWMVSHAVADHAALVLYPAIQARECRQYLARMIHEASCHAQGVICACDELGIDPHAVAQLAATDQFLCQVRELLAGSEASEHGGDEGRAREIIHGVVMHHLVGQAMALWSAVLVARQLSSCGLLVGLARQFDAVMHDVRDHHAFGCDLINTLKKEYAIDGQGLSEKMAALLERGHGLVCTQAREMCAEVMSEQELENCYAQVACAVDHSAERVDLPRMHGTHGFPDWDVADASQGQGQEGVPMPKQPVQTKGGREQLQ